ncbi:MAG: hypothetical protein PHQ66_01225 [Candidatus Nanoarchaeia archaeon]|nr:hypothetical protein [Candidatus Nanoarchaeia archaeon]MDD5358000.1 hypothetical protein [Candidatus Nanoarchaeia archaeon]MDD5588919.1 hypothetical protein [Candidatus Nanoarchaeia archaeon]
MQNKYYTMEIRADLNKDGYYEIPKKVDELAKDKGFYLDRGLEDKGDRDSIVVSWFNHFIMPDGDYVFFKGSKYYSPEGDENFYLKLVSVNPINYKKRKRLVDLCLEAGIKKELTVELDSNFRPK